MTHQSDENHLHNMAEYFVAMVKLRLDIVITLVFYDMSLTNYHHLNSLTPSGAHVR